MSHRLIEKKRLPNLKTFLPLLIIFLCFEIAGAATLTVTNTNDSGAGSLRQAIADAAGGDTIDFDLPNCPCTIPILSTGFQIQKSLTIQGLGADRLIIDGSNIADINRRLMFEIFPGHTVTFDGLTITRALGLSSGGIRNGGDFTLINSVVSQNSTGAYGGVSNYGTIRIVNSAIFNNFSFAIGGLRNDGQATVVNSTISGNSNGEGGGGIYSSGALTVINSTITNNQGGTNLTIEGSGIRIASGTARLDNTIVAGNLNQSDVPDDIIGTVTAANNNLIGSASYAGGVVHGVNGNIIGSGGVGTIDINTVLDTTLTGNGGATPTHALVAGSPAINAGNNALALDANGNPLATDQRGAGFPRINFAAVDIGAFESLFDSDGDGDGTPDAGDNCPLVSNPDQLDTDSDEIGNACDADDDGDGAADAGDNCPLNSNPDQADFDLDGIGDVCDAQTGPPQSKEQCKNGGWLRFNFPRSFINQGDCLRFLLTGD